MRVDITVVTIHTIQVVWRLYNYYSYYSNVCVHMMHVLMIFFSGGVSVISHRYIDTDAEENTTALYLDANNLYGLSMCKPLPYSNFAWLSPERIQRLARDNFKGIREWVVGETGLTLEVDVDIPPAMHDKTCDYPLLAEPLEIDETMISPFSLACLTAQTGKVRVKNTKLAPNLFNKRNLVVDIETLMFGISQGAELKHIHRGVSFQQRAWMKPYIDHNTAKRKATNCEFVKAQCKLLNNACFGKTLESVRKYMKIVLVKNGLEHRTQTSKPGMHRFSIFSDKLVGVEMLLPKVVLDRPISSGFCILESSKLFMQKTHYEVFKPLLKAKVALTDTDSYVYKCDFGEEEFLDRMQSVSKYMDFSNYPKDHVLYSGKNKAIPGLFKDEVAGRRISSFVGVRSKLYSLELQEYYGPLARDALAPSETTKRAMAGTREAFARHLGHADFKDVIFNGGSRHVKQKRIKSKGHVLTEVEESKLTMWPYDDKRFLLDAVNTRAHGHFRNV